MNDIISNEPVIPSPNKQSDQPVYTQAPERSSQICPICKTTIDARLYTSHLEGCIKKSGCKPLEYAISFAMKE